MKVITNQFYTGTIGAKVLITIAILVESTFIKFILQHMN